MRNFSRILLASFLLSAPALAQDAPTQGDPAQDTPALSQADSGPDTAVEGPAWIARPVELLRFPDQEAVSISLTTGDQVKLVYDPDDGPDALVRVRRGTDFGWVPKSALSDLPPEDTAAQDAAPPSAPGQ